MGNQLAISSQSVGIGFAPKPSDRFWWNYDSFKTPGYRLDNRIDYKSRLDFNVGPETFRANVHEIKKTPPPPRAPNFTTSTTSLNRNLNPADGFKLDQVQPTLL